MRTPRDEWKRPSEDVVFAAKPSLARQMIARALDPSVPCGRVHGDEIYVSDRTLRRLLEQRAQQ